MNNNLYPLAYQLPPGQECPLFYLGFPLAWKVGLFDIAQKNSPYFKKEYSLPTLGLKKLIDSWMDGIVALAPLKQNRCDARWLTSCQEYSPESLQALCSMIQVWVKATYTDPGVSELVHDFCSRMRYEELAALQTKENVCLTLENGTVCEQAYQVVPLLAADRLLGQEIILNGQPLSLCHAGKHQFMSHPVTDPGSGHSYSFVFSLSVQTTPPQRKALLLCQMSIRRWVPGRHHTEQVPFLSGSIYSHIQVSPSKYCQIPLAYDFHTKRIDWKSQDRECYNIWGYEPLPPGEEVARDPQAYKDKILLPYHNGMSGFMASKIGTGVSMLDKTSLYQSVSALLKGLVLEPPQAKRVMLRGQNFPVFSSPQEYGDPEKFRSWASKCTQTDQITFEIYGLWNDPKEQDLLKQIQTKIQQDFGGNPRDSCLQVQYLCKEAASLADAMPDDKKGTKIQRCDEIVQQLGQARSVTACIFVLPGQEHYSKGDPKQVLRNAFARTGRVVQFLNPDGETSPQKIAHCVYDLYRQLGIVTLLDFEKKMPPLADTPCVGMHVCTQVQGIAGKAQFLPLYVTVDVLQGKTQVHCDAFSNRIVSYREACLELAKLFWQTDLEKRCISASCAPAKQKLTELKTSFHTKEHKVLLVVQSDSTTRALWGGISDKEIGGYSGNDAYCPAQIQVGTPQNPSGFSLVDSGVRILRIRSNQEVPDYYTDFSGKSTAHRVQRSSVSGIFQYGDVYFGIHAKPNDPQYTNSLKASRIDHPKQRFAEKNMIELYPLQLQPGDNAAAWVFYTNALRHIPIQYNQSTTLPLPLHLAKALEEYLLDA